MLRATERQSRQRRRRVPHAGGGGKSDEGGRRCRNFAHAVLFGLRSQPSRENAAPRGKYKLVIPAKAGIQPLLPRQSWILAFAGMTKMGVVALQ